MDMTSHYAQRDPELVFLDECIAFIKTVNARTAMLIAEIDHIKKAIADKPQPDAEASHQSHQGE
jgi:hypothetical protein